MKKKSVVSRCGMAAVIAAAGFVGSAQGQLSQGADVVYTDCQGITNWGTVGGIRGYSLGSYTCNIGNAHLRWGTSWSGTPALGMNAYRLMDGRLEQIGLSFVKYSCCAADGNFCGLPCQAQGSSLLGSGCRDVYGASYNGGHSLLGPRSQLNPSTGQITRVAGSSGDVIFKRLQVRESDLNAATNPGALYFVEGVYIASDDAPLVGTGVNSRNNASYKRVTVGTGFALTPTGAQQVGRPAIEAWRDHGNGLNTPDPDVKVNTTDVAGDGRFHVASKAVDLGGGQWRYEYAVFNLNSHRAGGSFSVPVPSGATITGTGFKDVNYHSGEPYDNTDWVTTVGSNSVTWSSPQTFAQNANSNALRWGTMYNFWFETDAAPAEELAATTLGLFRPGAAGEPTEVDLMAWVPVGAGACAADWNGDQTVNSADISAFLTTWLASLQGGTLEGDFDGNEVVNSMDINLFLSVWIETINNGC